VTQSPLPAPAEDLRERLSGLLGSSVTVTSIALLPGGASKEAWAVDVTTAEGGLALLVRRAMGGAVYDDTLSLDHEFRIMQAAYSAGVSVPRPYGYLEDLGGRDALVMARIEGESIGRRIVRTPELAGARAALPRQMAEQLARIHSVAVDDVAFIPGPRVEPASPSYVTALERQLDRLPQPHPAIELGLLWLREHAPRSHGIVLSHGDFRLGNLMVDERGLAGVLDWENAHTGDPGEDLGWALVRAWRFGADERRLAGVGALEPYVEHYKRLDGPADLRAGPGVLGGRRERALGHRLRAAKPASPERAGAQRGARRPRPLAAEVEYERASLLETVG
jgi:aminoglycoside phosphotransferase (APT) family kinase protein